MEIRITEGVGFEPTETCASPVFKTGALNRSATPPVISKVAVCDRRGKRVSPGVSISLGGGVSTFEKRTPLRRAAFHGRVVGCALFGRLLQVLTDGFDGFAGGFGGIFGAFPYAFGHGLCAFTDGLAGGLRGIPSAFGNSRSAFAHRLGRIGGTLGNGLDSLTHGLRALPDRFTGGGSDIRGAFRHGLRTLADSLAGGLGGIPRTLGNRLGAFGGRFDRFTGFFDGLLHVLLGLITSGQTESGRRDNEEIRFHSEATVKKPDDWGNHIFAKIASEAQNAGDGRCILDTGNPRWFFLMPIAAKS